MRAIPLGAPPSAYVPCNGAPKAASRSPGRRSTLSTRALIRMSSMPAGRMDRLQSTAFASRKSLAVTKPRCRRARRPRGDDPGSPASPNGVSPLQAMRCEQRPDVPRCAAARSVDRATQPARAVKEINSLDQSPSPPVEAQVLHRSHGVSLLREVERRLVGSQQNQDPDGEMSHLKLLEGPGRPPGEACLGRGHDGRRGGHSRGRTHADSESACVQPEIVPGTRRPA